MYGGFLSRGAAAVDSGVASDIVSIRDAERGVGRRQSSHSRIGAHFAAKPDDVVLGRVLVPASLISPGFVGIKDNVRLLRGQQLIMRLACVPICRGEARLEHGRPTTRGDDTPVKRIISRCTGESVGGVK